jgi:hypothetical protein
MNFTRDNKLDALSGLFVLFGVALVLIASEFSDEKLMFAGVLIVVVAAVVRFISFRASHPPHLQ